MDHWVWGLIPGVCSMLSSSGSGVVDHCQFASLGQQCWPHAVFQTSSGSWRRHWRPSSDGTVGRGAAWRDAWFAVRLSCVGTLLHFPKRSHHSQPESPEVSETNLMLSALINLSSLCLGGITLSLLMFHLGARFSGDHLR